MKKIMNYFLMTVLGSMSTVVFTRYAEAQTNCSTQEIQIYQSYIQLVTQASYNMNFEYINQLTQEFLNKISPGCFNALIPRQPQQPYGQGYGGYSPSPPNVYGGGGGPIYVPGVGGCDGGGCIGY